jgi:anti-sigma-K factor RskA
MNKENHVVEHLPGYVLGSLSTDDYEQVAEHLAICSTCCAEMHTYEELVSQLALSVPQVTPPSTIKEDVLTRIAKPSKESKQGDRISWRERLFKSFQPLTLGWGAVSLLIIIGLGISNLLLWRHINTLRGLKPAPILNVINLSGTDVTPLASGLLVVSKDGNHGTLVVDDLPTLNEEQQYQLWLINNGQRTSGAVFSVGSDGYGSVWVDAPEPLITYSSFGITIEPAGGSPGPTGDKVLGGGL